MAKFKLPLENGFATLCAKIRAIKATADNAGSAVAALATATDQSLEEIEAALNDIPASTPFTILAASWMMDDTADDAAGAEDADDTMSTFPYYFDLAVEGVTSADHATVTLAPESYSAALACGLCPTNETISGAIRLRAATAPAHSISGEYWVEDGKENA